MAHTERTLTAPDGTLIHTERRRPPGQARASMVMLHGFAVHCAPYTQVAGAFADAGLDVTSFDCRGHGRSGGKRGHVARFTDFRGDLALVVDAVRTDSPGLPVVLLGHSHGALIALDYVLGPEPTGVSALVLASPFLALRLSVPKWKTALSHVMGRIWPSLALGNELRSQDTTRDPEVRARLAGDPLAHRLATPRWFNEVKATQARVRGEAGRLRVPTLMAVAGDDRIVVTETALAFAQEAGPIVKVKVYQDAFHELFLEPDWRAIVNDCASWVVARLAAPYT